MRASFESASKNGCRETFLSLLMVSLCRQKNWKHGEGVGPWYTSKNSNGYELLDFCCGTLRNHLWHTLLLQMKSFPINVC